MFVICIHLHAELVPVGPVRNQVLIDLGNSEGRADVFRVLGLDLPDQGPVESAKNLVFVECHESGSSSSISNPA